MRNGWGWFHGKDEQFFLCCWETCSLWRFAKYKKIKNKKKRADVGGASSFKLEKVSWKTVPMSHDALLLLLLTVCKSRFLLDFWISFQPSKQLSVPFQFSLVLKSLCRLQNACKRSIIQSSEHSPLLFLWMLSYLCKDIQLSGPGQVLSLQNQIRIQDKSL